MNDINKNDRLTLIINILMLIVSIISLIIQIQKNYSFIIIVCSFNCILILSFIFIIFKLNNRYNKLYNLYLNVCKNQNHDTIQYLLSSKERIERNKIALQELHVQYNITDTKSSNDFLDFEIKYTFKGYTLSSYCFFKIEFTLEAFDEPENISLKAIEKMKNIELGVEYNGIITEMKNTRIISFNIAFPASFSIKSNFELLLILTWKKYSLNKKISPTLIDPYNYAEDITHLNNISIEIINNSSVFQYKHLYLKIYNRQDCNTTSRVILLEDSKHNNTTKKYSLPTSDINKDNVYCIEYE